MILSPRGYEVVRSSRPSGMNEFIYFYVRHFMDSSGLLQSLCWGEMS